MSINLNLFGHVFGAQLVIDKSKETAYFLLNFSKQ